MSYNSRLGHTLVIANPASHSGKGAAGAETVRRFLDIYESATSGYDLKLTEHSCDAQRMAQDASAYDTVIVLGGDGVIHEAVNGLMTIDAAQRPRMGVIPLGSGNDYARTQGLTLNNPDRSLAELLAGTERSFDVGYVSSDACPEGAYFAETLSFGLDAAIALDTTTRRAEGTKQEGAGLFATSSIKLFSRAQAGHPCVVRFDDEEPISLSSLIFAVQNGPTYGGGFRICPKADPTDGLLDVCYNVRHPWVPVLLVLLGMARFGLHTGSRAVRLRTARHIDIEFTEGEPPCQVDGEELRGSRFSVEVEHNARRVIVPPANRW